MNVPQLAVIALLAQGATTPQPPATVEGVVVQSGTGQPVSGARVQLFHVLSPRPPGAPPLTGPGEPPRDLDDLTPYSAATSQDGRFQFGHVKPGEYRLVAFRSGGYVPGEFGQRSVRGLGVSFELSAGQQMRGVQLVVTPTGSISGRVYDRDGPAGRLQIQALRPIYRDGQRTLTIAQSVQTDDRGEYRLFWLPPGPYYIRAKPFTEESAGPDAGPETVGPAAVHITEPQRIGTFEQAASPVVTSRTLPDGEVVEETQVPVYYPGTTEASGAVRVDLQPGANADGLDIAITTSPVRTRRIRGMALVNGQPAAGAGITAVPRTSDPSLLIPSARTNADGSFEISGVLPGSQFVFARTNAGLTGGVALEVGDADVDNLVIAVTPGARVSGRFVIDGRSRTGGDPNIASLRAILRRDPDLLGMPDPGPTFSPPPAEDGAFELQGVPTGDFAVSVRALPPDAYIKSIRMGSVDVLDSGLHITGAPRDPLEIVIGANAGGFTGTVVDARQERLSNITVAIVPSSADRHRTDLYKTTTTDSSGRFRIRGLAAGNYAAFAWYEVEDGAWHDPAFMRGYESQGKSVVIRDGSDENVQLTVITGR